MPASAPKWEAGANSPHPGESKAAGNLRTLEGRSTQASTQSPASLTQLPKVASLHVQTVKVRAPFWPFRADRNWGALASNRQTGVAAGYFKSESRHSGDPRKDPRLCTDLPGVFQTLAQVDNSVSIPEHPRGASLQALHKRPSGRHRQTQATGSWGL